MTGRHRGHSCVTPAITLKGLQWNDSSICCQSISGPLRPVMAALPRAVASLTADLSFQKPSEGGRGKEMKSPRSGKGRGRLEGPSSTSETQPHTDTLANCFVELIAFWREVWAQQQELNEMAFLRGAGGL